MRRIALVLLLFLAGLALPALALRAALLPPALPAPEARDLVVRDVTLVEPGRPALPGRPSV